MAKPPKLYMTKLVNSLLGFRGKTTNYWQKNWWHKAVLLLISLIIIILGSMYGVALWYQHSQKAKPYDLGVSFIPDYATYLGVDPQQTMDALIHDVGVRRFRLTSYWSDIETSPGHYDFSQLDWEFQKAQAAHAEVSLSIGLRQPRWPECHVPDWAAKQTPSEQQTELEAVMTAIINRYKNSPSLASFELENEALLTNFGTCTDFSRARLNQEFALVKSLDSTHPIIMSRSNNFPPFLSAGKPQPDEVGMSMYRRVWDGTFTKHYITYPFTSWYFSFIAGMQKIVTGKNSMIHELQAEPWPPHGQGIVDTPLAEQNKTMNAMQLQENVHFAQTSGMKTIDLWGGEYWYYRKEKLHDDSVWNTAKYIFHKS